MILLVQYLFYDWSIEKPFPPSRSEKCPLFSDLDSARKGSQPLLAGLVGPALSRDLSPARTILQLIRASEEYLTSVIVGSRTFVGVDLIRLYPSVLHECHRDDSVDMQIRRNSIQQPPRLRLLEQPSIDVALKTSVRHVKVESISDNLRRRFVVIELFRNSVS